MGSFTDSEATPGLPLGWVTVAALPAVGLLPSSDLPQPGPTDLSQGPSLRVTPLDYILSDD